MPGEHRFRMELDAELGMLNVTHRHRHAVIRSGCDSQAAWNRRLVEAERVVADSLE